MYEFLVGQYYQLNLSLFTVPFIAALILETLKFIYKQLVNWRQRDQNG